MNASAVKSILRDNWYLVVLIGLCLVGAVVFGTRRPAKENVVMPPAQAGQNAGASTVTMTVEPPAPAVSGKETALTLIAEHQKKIDADPTSEQAPILLGAMGNLYLQKLQDPGKAAECYEGVLLKYPNYAGKRTILINLANCYEKMDDRLNAKDTYERMMETFPEDSQEYKHAQLKLKEL